MDCDLLIGNIALRSAAEAEGNGSMFHALMLSQQLQQVRELQKVFRRGLVSGDRELSDEESLALTRVAQLFFAWTSHLRIKQELEWLRKEIRPLEKYVGGKEVEAVLEDKKAGKLPSPEILKPWMSSERSSVGSDSSDDEAPTLSDAEFQPDAAYDRGITAAEEASHLAHAGSVRHLLNSAFRERLEAAVLSAETRFTQQQAPPARRRRPTPVRVPEEMVRDPIPPAHGRLMEAHARAPANEQVQEEEIAAELLNIVRVGAVANVLQSRFRVTLEQHLRDRLEQVGGGQQVQQYMGVLRQRLTERYGQGGAGRPPDEREAAVAEMYGGVPEPRGVAPGTAIAMRQLESTVNGLREEMQQMQRMLRTSFELSLEIQRSVRQEVAAVVGKSALYLPRQRPPRGEGVCAVCLESKADTAMYHCGHLCACAMCARQIMTEGDATCPLCRAPVVDVLRVFV